MITQQSITIFLWLGVVFIILPSLIHVLCIAYKYGFFPRVGKNTKHFRRRKFFKNN